MPGFALHYLYGADVYQSLPPCTLKSLLKRHHSSFSLGLQGPDLFFYYVPSHINGKNVGSAMHQGNPGALFKSMFRHLCRCKDPDEQRILTAYTAGFLGHYTLDFVFHPFVYGRTDFQQNKANDFLYYGRHFAFESDLDQIYLKKLRTLEPREFHSYRTIALPKKERQVISVFLQKVIKDALHMDYKASGLAHAVSGIRLGTMLLQDSTGLKKKGYSLLERCVFGADFLSPMFQASHKINTRHILNSEHLPWQNPFSSETGSLESADDLLEKASKCYRSLLLIIQNYMASDSDSLLFTESQDRSLLPALLDLTENRSFQTGLPVSENLS